MKPKRAAKPAVFVQRDQQAARARWRDLPRCPVCGSQVKASHSFDHGKTWWCFPHIPQPAGEQP